MSTQDARRARGVKAFNAVYGSMMTAPDEPTNDDFFELMLGNLFADIWAREGLSLRDRRLVLMGAIAAQGEADVFGIQVETGLGSGHLTEEQVNEMILQLTQYIGYPKTTGMRGQRARPSTTGRKSNPKQLCKIDPNMSAVHDAVDISTSDMKKICIQHVINPIIFHTDRFPYGLDSCFYFYSSLFITLTFVIWQERMQSECLL
jgi:4-carboxymuconolactone decarboxylase